MRIVFGILSLVVVLAVIGSLAKKQLQVLRVPDVTGMSASAPVLEGTPAQQSQQLQRKVTDDVNQLMQQAPARVDGAEK